MRQAYVCACVRVRVQSFRKSEPSFSIFLKCKRSVEGTVKLHKGKADGDKALLEFPKPVTGFTTRLLRKEETIQSFTGCPPCLLSRTFSLSLSPPPLLLLPSHCTSYATLKSRFSLFLSPPNCLALSLSLLPSILHRADCLRPFSSPDRISRQTEFFLFPEISEIFGIDSLKIDPLGLETRNRKIETVIILTRIFNLCLQPSEEFNRLNEPLQTVATGYCPTSYPVTQSNTEEKLHPGKCMRWTSRERNKFEEQYRGNEYSPIFRFGCITIRVFARLERSRGRSRPGRHPLDFQALWYETFLSRARDGSPPWHGVVSATSSW